ncbi:hypothetical protein P43SY_008678 [Pythium insidiosum]|uniref:Tc1-like transposase DDE domain-containing protein n=1 Tax=Pythium insidiosum TaxID=114742 RepID=A0AAD5M0X5_PYTIN|nr:hypothetical protein P43SY_008678 [Pythium insidiosum]
MVALLEEYISLNCMYTLARMQLMLSFDTGVILSTETISRHLLNKLYTTRIEPNACINVGNKEKRRQFAAVLLEHKAAGDYIVYYDETIFNLYCKRMQRRAKQGERAIVKLPASKSPNLEVQCAVSVSDGLILHRLQRGSIQMERNASIVEAIVTKIASSVTFQTHFVGKKIVVVFDNAPTHHQTEARAIVAL